MEAKMRKGYVEHSSHGGVRRVYEFRNGYGASVVRHEFSYGGRKGLWELAVLGKGGSLVYTSPVTSNVLGYLTIEEVNEALDRIEKLPKYPEGGY